MTALVGGGVAALPPAVASAAVGTVDATLVKTTWTGGPDSTWAHPSPDPSGITYNSVTGKLIISDGEVEETNLSYHVYEGTNLFVAGLDGRLLETGANTLAYSKEPTGVGFRPQLSAGLPERLFISDDDQARIFEVNRGGDGRYGTGDDTQTSSSVSFLDFGARNDAEDVAVDLEQTSGGRLLLVDGKGRRVFLYNPGPDLTFDGQGDFVEKVINVGNMGAGDPEGIAYNKARKTMFVLDDPSNTIYEVALDGTLLNRVTLPFKMKSGAGIALAPPSNGSGGAPNAYIVDRGVDNDTNGDTFNDGRLYEVAIPGLTGSGDGTTNTAPTVDAGPDQSVVLSNPATLDGTVSDSTSTGSLTQTWRKASGPGDVSFGDASAVDTTATFSATGEYMLELSATDGSLSASDTMTVTVSEETTSGSGVLDIPVGASTDDAEEKPSGSMALASGDLNLGQDGSAARTVGMRFTGVTVPKGAIITNAYVQFRADESHSVATTLTFRAESVADAAAFTSTSGDITGRPLTSESVSWQPTAWTAGDRATAQRTPDLAAVLQPVVNGSGWASGNALALVVTGSGERTAESYDGGAAKAPVLHIEYGSGSGDDTTNTAPTVDAGNDSSVTLPDAALLDGTVSDATSTGTLTSTWTEASGPGAVTFGNDSAVDTTASFSEPGTYVLRLTAGDGELSSHDDVTVTVSDAVTEPPSGSGVLDIPVRVGSDDAEERTNSGKILLGSGDLNLAQEDSYPTAVGMRFTDVTIPAGATITKAYVQFQADEVKTATSSLTIVAEVGDAPLTFTTAAGSISARLAAATAAEVLWNVASWPTAGERTADHRTPDLSPVLQELVTSGNWDSGDPVVLLVTGTGERAAESYEGGAAKAPVLHIEYTL
ncbi:hypothetical protein QOZ86_11335 [Blastococcus capsensis]|nr:hypothetical protein [Blastococcus capsensis]